MERIGRNDNWRKNFTSALQSGNESGRACGSYGSIKAICFKMGKQQFNTRVKEVMENSLLMSSTKYILQSPWGWRRKMARKASQRGDNQEPPDNIGIERDKKWKKSGGRYFNTMRGQSNKDLLFISLAKHALQSP